MTSSVSSIRRGLVAALTLLAFAACAPTAPAQPPEALAAAAEVLEPLTVVTAQGSTAFQVEIADTDAERSRGLMFRASMPDDRGMLFDFASPRPLSFWMKNTWIPLDIIFIGANGRVLNIARNTTPYSESPIPSDGPALAVLELRGGRGAEIGLEPGDRIVHRIFPRD